MSEQAEGMDPKVDGDNAEGKVKNEDLANLKVSVIEICSDINDNVISRRDLSHNTRFCFWDGQDESGKKLSKANGGKEVFPFEGASDARIRTADEVVNYLTAVLMAAATRASIKVGGIDGADHEQAARLRTLLKWVLQNKLGRSYFRELVKACQYMLGDSPGIAIVGIHWKQEEALEFQEITMEELPMVLAQSMGLKEPDPATSEELILLIRDPEQDEQALLRLEMLLPTLTKSRMKKVLKGLREEGKAEFPIPYLKVNEPELCTHRLFQDLFIHSRISNIQDAPEIHRRCLLTKSQVLIRKRMEGWSDAFVDGLLQHMGDTIFTDSDTIEDGISEITRNNSERTDRVKNKYEVIYTHQKLLNDDNVPAIYVTVWSGAADLVAKERYMLDYYHGNYPYVDIAREILNDSLWDSRGVPEIVATDQAQQKRQEDQFSDHSTLVTVPPFTVPRNRPHMKLKIAPLALVKEDRPGQIGPMKMMPYPRSSEEYANRVSFRVAKYFGIPLDGVPQSIVIAQQQLLVNNFLASLSDIVRMVVQLSLQYLDPEELMRVMGGKGGKSAQESMQQLPQTPRQIQQLFDIHFWLDVRTLDNDFVTTIAETIGKIVLPMDTKNTAQRDKLVEMVFKMIDPQLADEVLEEVDTVNMKEIEEEELVFVKSYSGVETEMQEDGQNFEMRLQWWQQRIQMMNETPDAFMQPSEKTQELWQKRIQHLEFMVQQGENAQTGRVGVQQ